MTKLSVQASNQFVRHRVFQDFGLIVDFVPAVAQYVHQERLQEPMPADHGDGVLPAHVGQLDTSVRGVGNQSLAGQLLDAI